MEQVGLKQTPKLHSQEQAVYIRNNRVETLMVGVYVDDMIIIGTSVEDVKEFKH